MPSRRDLLVRGGLVVAVSASVGLLAAGDKPPVPAVAVSRPVEPAPAKAEILRVDLLQRGAQETAAHDLFAAHTWQRPAPPSPPPPPPELEPPAPPPPSAPPLPFTFLGTFEAADGKPVYYLAEGDRVHTVGEGEVIDGTWRIERVTAEQIFVQYLPLSLQQPLALRNSK